MKLKELNKLVEKKNFFGIKKDLEKHIDELEDDAKEVRIDIVATFEKLTLKTLDKIEQLKKDQAKGDLSLGTDFDKIEKRLVGLSKKLLVLENNIQITNFKETLSKNLLSILKSY